MPTLTRRNALFAMAGAAWLRAAEDPWSQLPAILKRIQPEVIFLEIPSAVFDDYLDGTRSDLESSAAKLYRESDDVDVCIVGGGKPISIYFLS